MRSRRIAMVWAAAAALAACGGETDPERAEVPETPLPAQTPIGGDDVEPGDGAVVDPGEVPDADHDGVPNAQDTSLVP